MTDWQIITGDCPPPQARWKNPKLRGEKIGRAKRRGAVFQCEVCDTPFWRKPRDIKCGHTRFCSRACYQEWQRGRPRSAEFRAKCSGRTGSLNANWRGGITPRRKKIRDSRQYKEWRDAVFERDNYTCIECGARCGNGKNVRIEAHHIKPFATFPSLRFVVSNGATLCKSCHDGKPKGKGVYHCWK